MIQIKKTNGEVLLQSDKPLRELNLRRRNFDGANFEGWDLSHLDFKGSSFVGANMRKVNGSFTNWTRCNFTEANTAEMSFRSAAVRDIVLQKTRVNWESHDILAEILRQNAGQSFSKRAYAGYVLLSPEWCWKKFVEEDGHELAKWAVQVFAKHLDITYDGHYYYNYCTKIIEVGQRWTGLGCPPDKYWTVVSYDKGSVSLSGPGPCRSLRQESPWELLSNWELVLDEDLK